MVSNAVCCGVTTHYTARQWHTDTVESDGGDLSLLTTRLPLETNTPYHASQTMDHGTPYQKLNKILFVSKKNARSLNKMLYLSGTHRLKCWKMMQYNLNQAIRGFSLCVDSELSDIS